VAISAWVIPKAEALSTRERWASVGTYSGRPSIFSVPGRSTKGRARVIRKVKPRTLFTNGLAAADFAISLAPDETWLYSNRAHALMFLGRVNEARAIYLQRRGEKIHEDKNWETVILHDFAELREKGHTHPLMDEIEKLFAKKN
jgi:hypothetical protein